jgi:mannose-1-phosphate guanylyltransferase/mannose-6-phosphate isomerase
MEFHGMTLVPVILSGGAGSRLWPLSREQFPKQLLPLTSEHTMLQETALRVAKWPGAHAPVVVSNEHHRFIVAEQLRQVGLPAAALILEPVGRNTAPAVAAAALSALQLAGEGALLLVMPADHVLKDVPAFERAVQAGLQAAAEGKLVTFGVVPTRAETGYGYIRHAGGAGPVHAVEAFVEKPNAERAAEYVASGNYLWNSGMFLLGARRYLQELAVHAPAMLAAVEAAHAGAKPDLDFCRLDKTAFEACPADSIDYAVMEKTRDAAVVPLDAGWSDVGSWDSLFEAHTPDASGNVVRGDVVSHDSHGNYVYSESRLVATVGLQDHVVVETKDAVLVMPRSRAQDVKKIVEHIKAHGRGEHLLHREVFRPWGSYDSVDNGERHQVKRLTVKPGATLSLQMHHHRAEHWIVVKGTARVTCNDKVFLMSENESTYIPIGAVHRIENPGKVDLHIVEVQSGSYLGEDDIVRFEDTYGRQGTQG